MQLIILLSTFTQKMTQTPNPTSCQNTQAFQRGKYLVCSARSSIPVPVLWGWQITSAHSLCEGCECLFLKSCMLLTLRSCIFSGLSPIEAWEFHSLACNTHVTHMLYSETDVSKYRLHHWHNLAPCEKWKTPRHCSGGSVQHICIPTGFELMDPRGTKSIL